ncbi:MAG: ABC transporter permease subunit [Chloroflexi bacterium]|nr:ABC transporter permease subunit [Chloroflexota bacterium]
MGRGCHYKEERDKTVEFALTLPVTRQKLITFKVLAMVINSIALLLVTWGAVLANATAYQTDSQFYSFVSLSMLALFMLQLIFLAVGVFLGCAVSHYKRAGSLAVSICWEPTSSPLSRLWIRTWIFCGS